MKKVFSLLFFFLYFSLSFADVVQVDGIYYVLDKTEKTAAVSSEWEFEPKPSYSGSISIPSSITVSGQKYNVTKIFKYAFYECFDLTEIVLPNTIEVIGEEAFYSCEGLKEIVLPNSVKYIQDLAFFDCSSLEKVVLSENIQEIGNNAFCACLELTIISLPNSLSSIGRASFSGCRKLKEITIPSSMTSIGEGAFRNCHFLKDKFINSSNLDAEANEYWGAELCDDITNDYVYIKDNVVIGINPYSTKAVIPDYCIEIADMAFHDSKIYDITIGSNVKRIGERAFEYCTNLTNVEIPNNAETICDYAFSSCNSLERISIGDGVKEIGKYAFYECYSLEAVNFGSNVNSIKSNAFIGCKRIKKVIIPKSVTSISKDAFDGCIFTSLEFINNSSLDEVRFDYWGAKIADYSTLSGLYIDDFGGLIGYKGNNEEITIPDNVIGIGTAVFQHDKQLKKVILGEGVTGIGAHAFELCTELSEIVFDENLTMIERAAFKGCTNLSSIILPTSVNYLEEAAFMDCRGLESFSITGDVSYIPQALLAQCTSLSSLHLPESVTYIDDDAFISCTKLKNVVIPKNVTYIGQYAFGGIPFEITIRIESENPPVCSSSAFIFTYNGINPFYLEVPQGCKSKYESDYFWNTFLGISEFEPSVKIDQIQFNKSDKQFYNLNGQKINKTKNTITILHNDDGTSKKTIIK